METTVNAIRQIAPTVPGGMVPIYRARQLAGIPADQFNRELRAAVIAGVVSCESQHGRLPDEFRTGGYRDGSTLMVWVSLI